MLLKRSVHCFSIGQRSLRCRESVLPGGSNPEAGDASQRPSDHLLSDEVAARKHAALASQSPHQPGSFHCQTNLAELFSVEFQMLSQYLSLSKLSNRVLLQTLFETYQIPA